MSKSTSLYPPYINDSVGIPVFQAPYMQEDAEIASLIIKANYANLVSLCDRWINSIIPEKSIYYLPYSSLVIFALAKMRIYSMSKEQYSYGWMRENDCAWWIPTVAWRRDGDRYIPDHFACFLYQLYVDNPYAIATGREVYGFNKTEARFLLPDDIKKPLFSIQVLGFDILNHNSEGKWQNLFQVEEAPPITEIACNTKRFSNLLSANQDKHRLLSFIIKHWGSLFERDLVRSILGKIGNDSEIRIAVLLFNIMRQKKLKIPLVFLKQFRDVADSSKACYQAIVEADLEILQTDGIGYLNDLYQLRISNIESHPIAKQLGIVGIRDGSDIVSPILEGFWMKNHFSMNEGKELYRVV